MTASAPRLAGDDGRCTLVATRHRVGHLNVFLPAAALILYFGGSFFMLLPAHVAAERIGRYRVGHALIALTNSAVIGLLVAPLAVANAIDEPDVAMLAVLGLAAAVVGAPIAIAGLVCVHTARAAPDEAVF